MSPVGCLNSRYTAYYIVSQAPFFAAEVPVPLQDIHLPLGAVHGSNESVQHIGLVLVKMFVAQELRKQNIAEYLLYMWQVEDIIRAYDCSLTRIRKEYINRFNYSDEQKEEMIDWYGNLITMMNQEGKREQGHLQINQIVLQDLTELNAQLLNSTKFPFYNAEYYKVLPFIVELRQKAGSQGVQESEIETCMNALYGTMLLRLQQKEITQNTAHAIKEITTFIGMLSDYYLKDKTEGIVFDEE